ncbi:MAG: hypothetical protein EAZ57_06525 [Cytophagales bacterium]|nr:MAG: hypothetical protein EAZ67_07300 [Cytophagales bacterium]TAF60681.1 MAG: hypothetical protein EAZ57_06525 [Cytophagales bacterium]
MHNFKITVPSPCPADWDGMTPKGLGRACSACTKVVVDFTKMTKPQVEAYLLANHNEKICGHFYVSQLDENPRPKNHNITYWLGFYSKIKQKQAKDLLSKLGKSVLLLVVGVWLLASGCTEIMEPKLSGDVCVEPDTTEQVDGGLKIDTQNQPEVTGKTHTPEGTQ